MCPESFLSKNFHLIEVEGFDLPLVGSPVAKYSKDGDGLESWDLCYPPQERNTRNPSDLGLGSIGKTLIIKPLPVQPNKLSHSSIASPPTGGATVILCFLTARILAHTHMQLHKTKS